MKTIALIPIDNRSVCYELPHLITNLDDEYNLLLPKRKFLGDLKNNADINRIFDWLSNLKNIDYLIISLDTLAYGGLIPSRRSPDSFEVIKSRVNKLISILKNLNTKVYAFSSIMRISNNNINEEEKEYWNLYGTKIFDYSFNLHKTEVTCQNDSLVAANCASIRVPENILNDYLNTRNRNFEINKLYINLKKQGIFDTLVFSKDDCAQYGLNVKEANLLKEYSQGEKDIYIKTGADEIPLSLLSRAINSNKKIKITPIFTQPDSINKISRYEDISVSESVNSQIELSGGIISNLENADLILLVNNFCDIQGELVMNINSQLFNKELILPDKPYCIADIVNANGSDNNFVDKFLSKTDFKQFYGYAAWNTTGNTLGSVISSALTFYKAIKPNNLAFKILQLTRFLDDWAYQANIRAQIRENSNNLSNNIIKEKMIKFENILFNKFDLSNLNLTYSYPWNRFFEIEVNINSTIK